LKRFFILSALALTTIPGGTYAKPPQHQTQRQVEPTTEYYTNRDGNSVHRPMRSPSQPRGATAQCADGSWSFSQNHRGTCSYHGGVSRWL
jgi:hypothetical protein